MEDKKIGTETIEYPPTTLTYHQEKASGSVAKLYKDIYREIVQIEWTEENNKKSDTLVSFIFKPEKKAEQKS